MVRIGSCGHCVANMLIICKARCLSASRATIARSGIDWLMTSKKYSYRAHSASSQTKSTPNSRVRRDSRVDSIGSTIAMRCMLATGSLVRSAGEPSVARQSFSGSHPAGWLGSFLSTVCDSTCRSKQAGPRGSARAGPPGGYCGGIVEGHDRGGSTGYRGHRGGGRHRRQASRGRRRHPGRGDDVGCQPGAYRGPGSCSRGSPGRPGRRRGTSRPSGCSCRPAQSGRCPRGDAGHAELPGCSPMNSS